MNLSKPADILGHVCFFGGFASIFGSIAIWYLMGNSGDINAQEHGQRLGIFVGLWAPTFFILSSRLNHFAKDSSGK